MADSGQVFFIPRRDGNAKAVAYTSESKSSRLSKLFGQTSKENGVATYQHVEGETPTHVLGVNANINTPGGYEIGASFLRSREKNCPQLPAMVDRIVSIFPRNGEWNKDLLELVADRSKASSDLVAKFKDTAYLSGLTITERTELSTALSAGIAIELQTVVNDIFEMEQASREVYSCPLILPISYQQLQQSATEHEEIFHRSDFALDVQEGGSTEHTRRLASDLFDYYKEPGIEILSSTELKSLRNNQGSAVILNATYEKGCLEFWDELDDHLYHSERGDRIVTRIKLEPTFRILLGSKQKDSQFSKLDTVLNFNSEFVHKVISSLDEEELLNEELYKPDFFSQLVSADPSDEYLTKCADLSQRLLKKTQEYLQIKAEDEGFSMPLIQVVTKAEWDTILDHGNLYEGSDASSPNMETE